ncbi:hypothetical protein ACHQM5_028216 [Ranunculus cassubicifolius]
MRCEITILQLSNDSLRKQIRQLMASDTAGKEIGEGSQHVHANKKQKKQKENLPNLYEIPVDTKMMGPDRKLELDLFKGTQYFGLGIATDVTPTLEFSMPSGETEKIRMMRLAFDRNCNSQGWSSEFYDWYEFVRKYSISVNDVLYITALGGFRFKFDTKLLKRRRKFMDKGKEVDSDDDYGSDMNTSNE